MTTWTLKTTPTDGPATERRGLTDDQALWALRDLMYGDVAIDEPAEATELPRRDERVAA